jgi:SPOR domain
MPSSFAETAIFFLTLILCTSLGAYGRTYYDTTNTKQDTTLTGGPAVPIDTLLGKSDTSRNSQDTLSAKKDTVAGRQDTLDIIVSTEGLNTIPGFRVQIGSTQNLSEAIAERAKAETILADYNVYIIYDSPYYKVRAGDFRARYDASQAAGFISDHGFSAAWVVPDNVFKNPIRKSK